ncbi:MAG TPA: AMP-binding protein, partial [Solirubrobacteraceae bacterium]|nr:AMP-binding protein [Solirubrobacteraceae bacterium]
MRTQIHNLVAEAAGAHGGAPALTYNDVTLTYGALWRAVAAFGGSLTSLGVRRGDRVAVYVDKRIEAVTALFGTSAAQGVFVPINPLLRSRQVGYIIRDCEARVLVTTPERLALLREELQECASVKHVVLVDAESPARPGPRAQPTEPAEPAEPTGRYTVNGWPTSPNGGLSRARAIDADMAAILYTSGSTGSPKGVVLSHRNLIVGAESVSQYLGNTADDVILSVLPLSFDAGFSQLTTAFSVGAHVVLMNYLMPAEVMTRCARHRVTGLTAVPPLWIQLVDQDWPDEAITSLRYFANTGGKMPKGTLDRLRALFPSATPFLMYGLTEAFRSTYLDPAE